MAELLKKRVSTSRHRIKPASYGTREMNESPRVYRSPIPEEASIRAKLQGDVKNSVNVTATSTVGGHGEAIDDLGQEIGLTTDNQAEFVVQGHTLSAPRLEPGLHIVATPIGNLGDISLRALAILAAADLILAEDKRVTRNLLTHYGIRTRLSAYHEHNAAEAAERILERLGAGETLALVSDAGTPLISDPGGRLVAEVLEAGFRVFAAPGASAVLAALVCAGLPAERFFFEGFLPAKSGERRRRIRELEAIPGTLVFYEAPHRLAETLDDLAAVLGAREAAFARELTKKFETVRRGSLPDLAVQLAQEPAPKGEIVILVAPPVIATEISDEDIDRALHEAMKSHSQRDAVQIIAAELGLPKRRVYARALKLAGQGA